MRSKQLFQWLHRSVLLLIASIVVMLSTGCVCLFACSNPPPMDCMLPDEVRICKSGLFIKLADKNNPMPRNYEEGIEKNFQLTVQSDSYEEIKIACTSADAENAKWEPYPTCNFSAWDKVTRVFIENFTAPNVSITIEREGYREVFSDLALNYTKQVFDPCGPPGPACNVANLTLEVE